MSSDPQAIHDLSVEFLQEQVQAARDHLSRLETLTHDVRGTTDAASAIHDVLQDVLQYYDRGMGDWKRFLTGTAGFKERTIDEAISGGGGGGGKQAMMQQKYGAVPTLLAMGGMGGGGPAALDLKAAIAKQKQQVDGEENEARVVDSKPKYGGVPTILSMGFGAQNVDAKKAALKKSEGIEKDDDEAGVKLDPLQAELLNAVRRRQKITEENDETSQ